VNANLGYRLAPGAETRFFVGFYDTDQKKLPPSIRTTFGLSAV
jgi:iron complex outermembrane receptor protein